MPGKKSDQKIVSSKTNQKNKKSDRRTFSKMQQSNAAPKNKNLHA
jgi:hypothetical protein